MMSIQDRSTPLDRDLPVPSEADGEEGGGAAGLYLHADGPIPFLAIEDAAAGFGKRAFPDRIPFSPRENSPSLPSP